MVHPAQADNRTQLQAFRDAIRPNATEADRQHKAHLSQNLWEAKILSAIVAIAVPIFAVILTAFTGFSLASVGLLALGFSVAFLSTEVCTAFTNGEKVISDANLAVAAQPESLADAIFKGTSVVKQFLRNSFIEQMKSPFVVHNN